MQEKIDLKDLAKRIDEKRFFITEIINFKDHFEDSIIFVYPLVFPDPAGENLGNRVRFIAILDSFKLCLFDLLIDGEKIGLNAQKSIDLRNFLNRDILKVKITGFLGLRVEFQGMARIPYVYLDLEYYSAGEDKKDIKSEGDFSNATVNFSLSHIEPFDEADDVGQDTDKFKLPFSHFHDKQVKNINIGEFPDHIKSIYIREGRSDNTLVLQSWNPNKADEEILPEKIKDYHVLALYSDKDYIYASSENERIYKLNYSGGIVRDFHPRDYAFALSLIKTGDYLYAAMSDRTICRIDIKKSDGEILFKTLVSYPKFLVPLGKDKLMVTTDKKELIIFKTHGEVETNEQVVFENIRIALEKEKGDVRAICEYIIKEAPIETEEEIPALEFAAYTWSAYYPKDLFTPLKKLIYVINREFRKSTGKGDIISQYIRWHQEIIFKNIKDYSILLKEYYLTTRDSYRRKLLLLSENFTEVKNELHFFSWNGSGSEREHKLNLFGLYACYKGGLFIEYVKTLEKIGGKAKSAEVEGALSCLKITDPGDDLQQIAVVESRDRDLYLLEKEYFEGNASPHRFVFLDKIYQVRKIEIVGKSSGKRYLFCIDGSSDFKVFDLIDKEKQEPYKREFDDFICDFEVYPVPFENKNYELIVLGFRNSGFGIYLFDFEQPGKLALLHSEHLQNDWIRDLEIFHKQGFDFKLAAVGYKRKKLYQFDLRLSPIKEEKDFAVELEKNGERRSPRPLLCVKYHTTKEGNIFLAAGCDQGSLIFLDDRLNIKWCQELGDGVRHIKEFVCEDGEKELVVELGNGDIYFFSEHGNIRREIKFGKPLFAVDTALLDKEKGKGHLIAGIENDLIIYEDNRQEIVETKNRLRKSEPAARIEEEILEICDEVIKEYEDTASPVLNAAESLQYYYQLPSFDYLIEMFHKNPEYLSDYYRKDKAMFRQLLGIKIEEQISAGFGDLEKILLQMVKNFPEDQYLYWLQLRYFQEKYRDIKRGKVKQFLKELSSVLIDPTSKRIKKTLKNSDWLLSSTAITIANVLNIDEKNILVIINDFLSYNMPHEIYRYLVNYFNHKPLFEFLFTRYSELDESTVEAIPRKLQYFLERVEKRAADFKKANIENLDRISRFYRKILEAAEIDSLIEMQRKDMDIFKPLYELETAGFEIRQELKDLLKRVVGIKFKRIEDEIYLSRKNLLIDDLKKEIGLVMEDSRKKAHLDNKFVTRICERWMEILDREQEKYNSEINLVLLETEIVSDITLKYGIITLENRGGCKAENVKLKVRAEDLVSMRETPSIIEIKAGPRKEITVPLSKLVENPGQKKGNFQVQVEISYQDINGNERFVKYPVKLKLMASEDFKTMREWDKYQKMYPDLFFYPAYYPNKYDGIQKSVNELVEEKRGLLFLEGGEGTGRRSLLLTLSLEMQPDGNYSSFYIEIAPDIKKIPQKKNRLNKILHMLIEKIIGEDFQSLHETVKYKEKLLDQIAATETTLVFFINKLDELDQDSLVKLYGYLEDISNQAVVIAAININIVRLFRQINDKTDVIDITRIDEGDQQNVFKQKLGENYLDFMPENWEFLVGDHAYSTFVLSNVLAGKKEKLSFDKCVDKMWAFSRDEIKNHKKDYYGNIWNTLSLNEKLIVYACAVEDCEIEIEHIKPGLIVGKDPFLAKGKLQRYGIIAKVKEGGTIVDKFRIDENMIFNEDSIAYIKRARDRMKLLMDTREGYFRVKVQTAKTMLDKNSYLRIVLANYLYDEERLEKKLEELCSRGILRKIKIGGGGIYYAHNDYFFMIYLLREFPGYNRLVAQGDLITAYTLQEIRCAVTDQFKTQRELNQFLEFLGINVSQLKILENLTNSWEWAKSDRHADIETFYFLLEKTYHLGKFKNHSKLNHFDHFHEGFYRFMLPAITQLNNVILYVVSGEEVEITQLDSRLSVVLDEYKLVSGSELIFIVTLFDRMEFKLDIDKHKMNIVLLDENSLKKYIQSTKKELELLHQMSRYLDLRTLSPYRYTKGVMGDMFVGRKKELAKIFNKPDKDYTIFGERQIGKTSLLKQVEYQCKVRGEQAGIYAVFIDLFDVSTGKKFFEKLSSNPDLEKFRAGSKKRKIENMTAFEELLADFLKENERARLIFLVDEIDDLYGNCFVRCPNCDAKQLVRTENYNMVATDFRCSFCGLEDPPLDLKEKAEIEGVQEIFAGFRSLSQIYDERCQFVFTGFKILYQIHSHHGAELFNFTENLTLEKLEYEDLKSLILEPMKRLGIGFTSESDVIERIYNESFSGIPWIVQYYCGEIIEKLADLAVREVSVDLIDEITLKVKPEVEKNLKNAVVTSREWGVYNLIKQYRKYGGDVLGGEFRIEDLLEYQDMMEIKPDQLLRQAELEHYLDLFSRCFFLDKELKIQGKKPKPELYYVLKINPDVFEI
ncbi:MAG: hypothetical protein KAW12_21160 [Candidatus Aminicenantes bacterium]|nr:hypothetical protein [Candidatus Aminicenantes bacterium]